MKNKKYEKLYKNYDSDLFVEMANLDSYDTGLSKGTIYISSREGQHGPRIKYYRGRAGSDRDSASISISDNPEIIVDSIGLKSKEIKELVSFILLNKKHLMKIWNNGTSMFTREILDGIKRI